jgi:hypothetical protein
MRDTHFLQAISSKMFWYFYKMGKKLKYMRRLTFKVQQSEINRFLQLINAKMFSIFYTMSIKTKFIWGGFLKIH